MKLPIIEDCVPQDDKIQKDVRPRSAKRGSGHSKELKEKKDYSSVSNQIDWSQECSKIYPYCLIQTLQKERNDLFLRESSENKNISKKSESAVNSLMPFSLTEIQKKIIHRQITRVKELEKRILMDEKRKFKVYGKCPPK